MSLETEFTIGQIVEHQLFHYRGVIYDVDAIFMLSDEWYERMAKSRPPKDRPWFHVLVDGAVHTTYVAQQNLRAAKLCSQVDHPLLGKYFKQFIDGRYISAAMHN